VSLRRYTRWIVLIVATSAAAQLGLLVAIANAEPPPPPPSVSLEAEHSSVKVSESIHLTATAASNVGPTPYTIRIFNADTHGEVASCGTGTTCTASVSVGWEENEHPTTHHYYAEVNGGTEGLYTRSSEVAVDIEHFVFLVSLSASPSTVTIPASYTLKATSSSNVGPTPYSIRIIENGTNKEVGTCGSGAECSATITSSYSENSSAHLHSFHAVVASVTYTAGESGAASVAVMPFFFTVSLSLTFDHSEEVHEHVITWDKAVATTDRNVGPTPYYIVIRKDGAVAERCGTGTECRATVEAGHSYTASVEDKEGNNFGGTVLGDINVAKLGGLYASASAFCETMLTDPFQTHLEGSPGDQYEACEAAIGRGASLAQAISAVAATAGGSGALWWALHEGTVSQPGFELPAPTEADPYPVPVVLPEAWPLKDLATEIEAKNSTSELTKEQAEEVTRRCLWYMSQVSSDASECSRLPIFASGSDFPTATLHDLKALATHPTWVRLNYSARKEKLAEEGVKEKWYLGEPGCEGSAPEGKSCDEYPFFATEQGGPEATIKPSLEWIVHTDNTEQGSRYGAFVRSCKMAERSSTGYAFAAVPIPPSLGMPTTRLCN
jgi:diaminopimelate epimerase